MGEALIARRGGGSFDAISLARCQKYSARSREDGNDNDTVIFSIPSDINISDIKLFLFYWSAPEGAISAAYSNTSCDMGEGFRENLWCVYSDDFEQLPAWDAYTYVDADARTVALHSVTSSETHSYCGSSTGMTIFY